MLTFLTILLIMGLLVLGIACANVVNLSVAQAYGRHRDFAVRLALGATRWRLLSQMLTESVVLSLGGGVLGVALSLWATRAVAAFRVAAPVPLDLSLSVNARVLLYAFIVSVSAGVLFGFAPAWSVVRPLLVGGLRAEQILTRPGRIWSIRNLMAVSQITMSVALLCATGLFLHSLQNASRINIGFRSRGLLMMSIDPRLNGYSDNRSVQLLQQMRKRVTRLPGVISATYTDAVPLNGGHRSDGFALEGKPAQPGGSSVIRLEAFGGPVKKCLVDLVISLYPRSWRDRYGEEFEALLIAEPGSLRTLANAVRFALREHIIPAHPCTNRQPLLSFGLIVKKPSAVVPIGMSLAALAAVLAQIAVAGIARQTDEGASAHIWQLLMGGQMPVLLWFAMKWLPKAACIRSCRAIIWPTT